MASKKKTTDSRFTKTQIIAQIAEDNELSKKQVDGVLESLSDLIQLHINKKSVGEFVVKLNNKGKADILTTRKTQVVKQ